MRRPSPLSSSVIRPIGFATVLICLALVTVAAGGSGFAVTVPNSIDVPDRTVTYDGTDYTISKIGRVNHGANIDGTVDAPDGEAYRVYLKDSNGDTIDTQAKTGDSSYSFSTSNLKLDPGTYSVLIYDGEFKTVVPVVVSGYDVTADIPGKIQSDDSATVTISVTATASSGDPHQVQVVLADDTETLRVNATRSDGDYVATFNAADLSPGEYAAYAVVRGENETSGGQKVLLGVSDRHTMTVSEDTPTPTSKQESRSTGGDTTSDSEDSDTSMTVTDTNSPTRTATMTSTPSESVSPTSTSPATQTSSTSSSPTSSPTQPPMVTDNDVVTPSSKTPVATTPTSQPGFGIVSMVIGLIGALLLLKND